MSFLSKSELDRRLPQCNHTYVCSGVGGQLQGYHPISFSEWTPVCSSFTLFASFYNSDKNLNNVYTFHYKLGRNMFIDIHFFQTDMISRRQRFSQWDNLNEWQWDTRTSQTPLELPACLFWSSLLFARQPC